MQEYLPSIAPYLRTDTYTPFLCQNIVGYTSQAFSSGQKLIQLTPFLVQQSKKVSDFISYGADTVFTHTEQYPKVANFLSNVKNNINIVPTNSSICDWVNQHSTQASSNAFTIASNPQRLLSIQSQSFLQQPFTRSFQPLLNSTCPINFYHILHTVLMYSLTIMVIVSLLKLIHYIIGLVLGIKSTSTSTGSRETPLYLFGIETYDVKDINPEWGVTIEEWYQKHLTTFGQTKENAEFVKRVQLNSGLSEDKTYLPRQISTDEPNCSIKASREESFDYITHVLTKVFRQYNILPTDVDVLVINCSLFNPTPSHCAMAINHFKMRNDIVSYAIHGMGCSASAIAVNACRDALLSHPKKKPIGIVISFENLTMNFYHGAHRAMLVPNALFRLGAAAMVFGRTPTLCTTSGINLKALYECEHLIRTCIAASDEAYGCIWQEEDEDGCKGVRLHKDVPKIAAKALTVNITRLARLILPYRELISYGTKIAWCKLFGGKPGSPNFLTAVDHVCIHAGGRGVIDTIENDLKFPPHITKPSREILHTYGNQSSASVWYIFSHLHTNVKRGQRVWQITFGSGFKANSLIWRRL